MPEPRRQRSQRAEEGAVPATRTTPGKQRQPFWRTRWAKRILALVCLVAAAAIEWKLVNLPSGDVSGQFPTTVKARDEVVTFSAPGSVTGGPFSFAYSPPTEAEKVLVDAYFDNAQLSDETLKAFKLFQISAPSSAGIITYLTSGEGSAACSTKIQVEPADANLKSVEFSQSGSDITSGYRSLGASFAGAPALVTLSSQGVLQNGLSPCRIELSVGDWTQATQGFMPIKMEVPPDAHFRFHWQNLDERSSTWKTRSSALPLLSFGSSASDEFTTQTIAISTVNPKTGALNPPAFEARGAKQSPLTVLSFGINQKQLEIKASGNGRVLKDGKVVNTTNVLETLNKNPILSALFAAGNLALIGWAGRMFFPRTRKKKAEA
jgi:hypothetical protein